MNIVANIKYWMIDYGAIRHMFVQRKAFSSYKSIGDDNGVVYLGDSKYVNGMGKRKVQL